MKSPRHGALAAKAGLALLVTAGLMTPAYAAEEEGSDSPASKAAVIKKNRIMSWNSNGQKNGTTQRLVDQVRIFKPQIVLLQESCKNEVNEAVEIMKQQPQKQEYEVFHSDWPDIGDPVNDPACLGQLGHAILVAKGTKIDSAPETARYREADGIERRKFMMFQTRLAGKKVRIFNTQLSDAGDANLRHSQLLQLSELVPGTPNSIIAGDLNAQPWYWEMKVPWANGFKDADPYCKQTWDRRCNGTQYGSGKKFDYILSRGKVNTKRCYLGDTPNEDHRVVISDVTAGPPSRKPCKLV
ncbi:endonuclease/exonuclease/phosphatase family protein [Streptomyces sp. NPDC058644]|uniref:endonuclease/exonuclease/phosphatase family protein n=1 Tax=unclassified Streptomyces TaxID=2593676 RepID=UPI0036668DDA